jgi:hypothetical protein
MNNKFLIVKKFIQIGIDFFELLLKRIILFITIVFIFICIALLQHWFVHQHLYSTANKELVSWAEQINNQIAYKSKWDLIGYRWALIDAPKWYVITNDSLIIDIEGFLPGLFGRVKPINDSIFYTPKTVTTSCNETWRVFGKKVLGGEVILGIMSIEKTQNPDAILMENLAKFGTTIKEATSIKSRDIDWTVDYAVVANNGELLDAFGAVPLKMTSDSLLKISKGFTSFDSRGIPYILYIKPILNQNKQQVGLVIVQKNISLQQQALKIQDKFNYLVVGLSGMFILIMVILIIGRELLQKTNRITFQDALKSGESLIVEYKSTFQWDVILNQPKDERILDVLKSIAGFLNAKGGILLIGVEQDETGVGKIRGIKEDLQLNGGSKDRLQLKLQHLITDRIGSKFSPNIEENFEEINGKLCLLIRVERSKKGPAFVRWHEDTKFFIREGPRTKALDNENTWLYIKNKWG